MNSLIISCPPCGAKNRIPAGKQHLAPKCGKCGKQLDPRPQAISVELTDSEFQSFISASSLPLLVDFYSPTCGPCKAIAPVISNLTKEYLGKVIIGPLRWIKEGQLLQVGRDQAFGAETEQSYRALRCLGSA